MAEITAAVVKALREQTGQGMMECKKALQEAGGDLAAAADLLRKKGLAIAEKKAGRETKEGRISISAGDDGRLRHQVIARTNRNWTWMTLLACISRRSAACLCYRRRKRSAWLSA